MFAQGWGYFGKSPVGRKGSFYVAVFRDKYYYKVLRFSDHKAAVPYLAIPTIDYTVSRSILRARIEKALNEPWVRFTFESFYALKVIEKWAEHRVSIFYERAYKQKKYHKHSFYLIEDYALEGKRTYLSENVSKELRRLWSNLEGFSDVLDRFNYWNTEIHK